MGRVPLNERIIKIQERLALRLHGQLSISKLFWLLDTRGLIGETADKKTWAQIRGKSRKGFRIWYVAIFIIHEEKKNKMLLESLNTEVFNFEHMPYSIYWCD